MNKLVHCPHCGKIYTVTDKKKYYITDMGGELSKCFNCDNNFDIEGNSINTEPWISHLVFTVKGH